MSSRKKKKRRSGHKPVPAPPQKRFPALWVSLIIAVAVAAVLWYFFKCQRYPEAGLLLGVLPLFFAWRSLWGYFFYIDIIILAAIMLNEYGMESNNESGKLLAVNST